MADVSGPVRGTAITWHREQGWGVLRSPDAPADVWCHFSAICQEGYRELITGETVAFTFRAVEQDRYHYAAVEVRRNVTAAGDLSGSDVDAPQAPSGYGTAYDSCLTLAEPDDRRER